ncbi:hypothetical protein D3C86_1384790 [compost metagenome]
MSDRRAGQRIELLLVALDHLDLLAPDHLLALQPNQHVRHADVREHLVVGPHRTARVIVEGTQVGIQPIGAAYAGDQRQIRRHSTEPCLGIVGLHADLHVVANLGIVEDQVIQHQFMRDTQVIGHPLITLELGAMTAHAIVGEGTRTILHSGLVGQIDLDLVQRILKTASGKRQARQKRDNQCCKMLFHQPVTLSGTGLVFSILV